MLIDLPMLMIPKEKIDLVFEYFNNIQIQLLILYPYMGVPQTVHIY